MTDRNLDISLRIKAEMDQARAQLDQFNKSLSDSGKAATAAAQPTRAQTAALSDLLSKIDPTVAKLEKLDQLERKLGAAKVNGLIDDEGFARFSTAIDKQRTGLNKTSSAMHSFSLNSANARREFGFLAKDLATGQYGRLTQSTLTLANYTGLMSAAFSGVGLAIITPVALLGTFAAVAINAYREEQTFNRALLATGNYAGMASASLQQMATNVGASTGNFGAATTAVLKLAQSGRFTGDQLGIAAQAAVNMAHLTGQSVDQAVAKIVQLQDNPVQAVRTLNDQYHFLTASTYQHIQALVDEGDQAAAAAEAQQALSDALATRVQQDIANMAPLERAWHNLNNELRTGLHLLLQAGSQSIEHQLDSYYAKRGSIQDDPATGMTEFVDAKAFPNKQAALDYIDQQIAALKDLAEQKDKNAKQDSDQAAENTAGIAALGRLHALAKGYDQVADRQAIVKKLNADLDLQWKTTSTLPEGVDMAEGGGYSGSGYDYLLKKALGDRSKPKVARAKSDAAAIAAQQQLIQSLQQLQGQLDPVAAAWARYNQEVDKADKAAARAKTAKDANIEAIDAERNAIVQLAATARDNALAKLTDKDREAWEKLRDSLRTPVEVATDKAVAQLTELNRLMTQLKGTKDEISPQQYADAVKRIADNSVGKAPQYQGIDAAVGGVGSELAKNFRKQSELEAWHQNELNAAEDFRAKNLNAEALYQQKLLSIKTQYDAQNAQIDKARVQLSLMTASQGFASLAEIAKAGYGEQSKQYRIAFALSKAFAVAQAAVALAQNVANASKVGFPYNIPLIVGAFAQGASIAALLSSATYNGGGGGYAEGGYTGPGGKYQVAGVVHAGEGVLSQRDMSALGGPAAFETFRRGLHGYAEGGFVHPLAGVPAPSLPTSPRAPSLSTGDTGRGGINLTLHNHNYTDIDELRDRIMTGPKAEAHTINHVLRNGRTVKQGIG